MRRNGEGGGWQGEGRFPGPVTELAASPGATAATPAPRSRGTPLTLGRPDTARGRRLTRQGLSRRLRPSPQALPALVPRGCCGGRHRNNTASCHSPAPVQSPLPRSGPLKRFKSTAARKGAKAHYPPPSPTTQSWCGGKASRRKYVRGWLTIAPGVPLIASPRPSLEL